jgi:hypothetical protein
MIMRLCVLLMALVLLSACVKAVTTSVGAAAGAGTAVVKTTAGVSGDVVEAAFSGNEKSAHHDDNPRPFDETRDAMQDVDAALAAAAVSGRNVLLVLGGNWCHDSRGLAAKFDQPELAGVIAESYELVWVDVGYRDRNLDVAARFGVMELLGTPTVLILSPEGALLNRDSVHDWRTADSKPYDETLAYFQKFSPQQ